MGGCSEGRRDSEEEEFEEFFEGQGARPAATVAGGGSSIRAMHSEQYTETRTS
jgi:hypothetical protein